MTWLIAFFVPLAPGAWLGRVGNTESGHIYGISKLRKDSQEVILISEEPVFLRIRKLIFREIFKKEITNLEGFGL